MGKIIELSQHVANQIAAGEVVERPASVVKELVENALDAGARAIEVRIKDGGFSHVIVSDDGEGMDEADVTRAVKRYATSKLETVSDLNNLSTHGFRGEALPSIASISMMNIQTKTAQAPLGVKAIIDAGVVRDVYAAQVAQGTRIEVRDLFFNVPARLKFARSKRAEASEIDRMLRAFAFVHGDIAWKFFVDNQLIFSCSASDDAPMSRAVSLLGRDTEGNLFSFERATELIYISGVISSPLTVRKDTRNVVFFVNKRLISDKKLVVAVKTAFRSLLEVGRNPVCALNITIEPDLVDVNVHPRKAEVRFADERRVMAHVISMITEFLSTTPWLSSRANAPSSTMYFPPPRLAPREDFDYLINPNLAPTSTKWELRMSEPKLAHHNSLLSAPRFSELTVIGQVRSTYLLTESEHGLVIIDQHAAHERIMYEKFLREKPQSDAQNLLIPIAVPLTFSELSLLEEHHAELISMGVEIEIFGKDTALIRALPRFLLQTNAERFLKDVLADLTEWGRAEVAHKLYAHLCATLACHAAIRAGQRLSHDEIVALLQELDGTDFHAHCPHGRPLVKSFSSDELKRWFDRT